MFFFPSFSVCHSDMCECLWPHHTHKKRVHISLRLIFIADFGQWLLCYLYNIIVPFLLFVFIISTCCLLSSWYTHINLLVCSTIWKWEYKLRNNDFRIYIIIWKSKQSYASLNVSWKTKEKRLMSHVFYINSNLETLSYCWSVSNYYYLFSHISS